MMCRLCIFYIKCFYFKFTKFYIYLCVFKTYAREVKNHQIFKSKSNNMSQQKKKKNTQRYKNEIPSLRCLQILLRFKKICLNWYLSIQHT